MNKLIKRSSQVLIAAALAVLLTAAQGRCGGKPSQPDSFQPAGHTLAAVAAKPAQFLGKSVTLQGILENEGDNYFTDFAVILKDGKGSKVYVKPWLPRSLPPSPPGLQGERPKVLSDYLGKTVELTAIVRHGPLRKLGDVYFLEVESARVADDPSGE